MKLNPESISWQHDGLNTDGTPFNPELFDGWELFVDGMSTLAIPVGWNQAGNYTAPVFGALTLTNGQHEISLRLLSKSGNHSALSNPLAILVDGRTPSVPFAVAASGGLEA